MTNKPFSAMTTVSDSKGPHTEDGKLKTEKGEKEECEGLGLAPTSFGRQHTCRE